MRTETSLNEIRLIDSSDHIVASLTPEAALELAASLLQDARNALTERCDALAAEASRVIGEARMPYRGNETVDRV